MRCFQKTHFISSRTRSVYQKAVFQNLMQDQIDFEIGNEEFQTFEISRISTTIKASKNLISQQHFLPFFLFAN